MFRVSVEEEMEHWRICTDDDREDSLSRPLDILQSLSPVLQKQIAQKMHLPSSEDTTTGAWRLFGAHCPCKGVVKEELLYCTCIARKEPLDPHFSYRTRLLQRLLEWLEEENGDNETDKKKALQFLYRRIAHEDKELCTLARSVAPMAHTQLVQNTFACLRQDGIVHIVDAESDSYLLLSRTHVLEPFIEASMTRTLDRPIWLQCVPSARLHVVRRRVLQKGKDAVGES